MSLPNTSVVRSHSFCALSHRSCAQNPTVCEPSYRCPLRLCETPRPQGTGRTDRRTTSGIFCRVAHELWDVWLRNSGMCATVHTHTWLKNYGILQWRSQARSEAPCALIAAEGTGGTHRAPWRARRAMRALHRRRPRQRGARRAEPRRRVIAPPAAPRRRPRSLIPGVEGQPPTPAHMCRPRGVQRRRAATPPTGDVPRQDVVRLNAWCCHTAHHSWPRARSQAPFRVPSRPSPVGARHHQNGVAKHIVRP
jgi:hypothetical protein